MTEISFAPLEKYFNEILYTIRNVAPQDAPEVIRLFEEVFQHQADIRWYGWKYFYGRGNALGMWDESGRLKAHCGGIPRTVSWCGKYIAGLQVGDVMVSPELRGILSRTGPFQQISSHFYQSRVGADRSYHLAWGFPNQRHMRLGSTLGLFWDAGRIYQASWKVGRSSISPWHFIFPLAGADVYFDKHINTAWNHMAGDLKDHVLGVRDSAYVRWRFLTRPDCEYKIFCLRHRISRNALAIIIMRITAEQSELLDIIAPRSMVQSAMCSAMKIANQVGIDTVNAWVSSALVDFARNTGAVVTPSEASLAIIKESTYSEDELRSARWWWMGGDTDFL